MFHRAGLLVPLRVGREVTVCEVQPFLAIAIPNPICAKLA